MEAKVKNKKLIVIVIIALIIAVSSMIVLTATSSPRRVHRQLDLGQKYLDKLDYEQAIASFDKALEIEPNNETVLSDMAAAYVDWGKSLVSQKDYAKAVDVLKDGYAKTSSADVKAELDEANKAYSEYQAEQKLAGIAAKLAKIGKSGDRDALFSFMDTDEYKQLTDHVKSQGKAYITETESGGIGIYSVSKSGFEYMVYIGDFKGDKREGSGLWIGHTADDNYIADGSWSNDYPNGKTKVEWQWPNASDNHFTKSSEVGNVINGLYDGDIVYDFTFSTLPSGKFQATFNKGKSKILKTEKDGCLVIAINKRADGNEEYMTTSSADFLFGIEGFGDGT